MQKVQFFLIGFPSLQLLHFYVHCNY
jgi:hypothetical protein